MDKDFWNNQVEYSVNRLDKIANKIDSEIYEQGDITISVDDVFAIQTVLIELAYKESTIDSLKNKIETKTDLIKDLLEEIRELKKVKEMRIWQN